MSLAEAAGRAAERWPLPDRVTAFGISQLVGRTRRQLAAADPQEGRFVREMSERPIAEFTDAANEQHYALPPAFFAHVLGPQRKYSCCLYDGGAASLGEAEEAALTETADHARLADGQRILELGCGWGSLSMWMAQRFPAARITAMSNSAPQRAFIEALAAARGLANLQVVTEDINRFVPAAQFDRIVSVEMFEHVANWPPCWSAWGAGCGRMGGCSCMCSAIAASRIGSTTPIVPTGLRSTSSPVASCRATG